LSSVYVLGVQELLERFQELEKNVKKNKARALHQGAQMVRADAIKSIQTVSHGRTVKRTRASGKTYDHTASKEGDAPNTDTGALVRSIGVEVVADDVYVGSTVKYAPDLEFGTRHTEPRPWLNPALERNKKAIVDLIDKAVRES
jgi:HK97 gp10 family phage protein